MTKRVWVLATIVSALTGCALLKQGVQEASEGIEVDRTAIPEGTGWHCYVANERQWSGCWRTAQECNEERDRNKTAFQIDTLTFQKWGSCNPAATAYCLSFQELETQSDGSAKYMPRYDCMPDDLSCGELSESRARETGKGRVSKCASFN
jgi:hypothetical protein